MKRLRLFVDTDAVYDVTLQLVNELVQSSIKTK